MSSWYSHAQKGDVWANLLLESISLFKCQAVRLGNNRNNIDDLAELLHDDNVNSTEGVAGGVDEEQATVNTCVLNVAVTHSCQLLTEVCTVLVLNVLDDRIPAMM